jgi:hypothetical protein
MNKIIPVNTKEYTLQERVEACGEGDRRGQVFSKRGRKVFWRH